MPDDPPDPSAPDEDAEFYYGLNRRSAQRHDAPFANSGLVILVCGLLLIPLAFVLALLTGNAILFLILFAFLLLFFPYLLPVVAGLAVLVSTSVIELLRQLFISKDEKSGR